MSPETKKSLVAEAVSNLESQLDALATDESNLEGEDVNIKIKIVISTDAQ